MTDDMPVCPDPFPAGPAVVLARRTALLLPLAVLPGCGFFDTLFGDTKKKLPGTREDVLPVTEGLQAPHGDHPGVVLPPPAATDWPVAGGQVDHDAGNAALAADFKPVWTAPIGVGSAYRRQVTAQPIVVGDTVFTMDSAATITAFATADGHRLWQTRTRPKKIRSTNIGGGIGYADGRLFASTGYGEAMALNPATGDILWRKPLDTPGRSAPTPANGMVFLTTIDQQLVGLSARDGAQVWSYDASPTVTTLLGQPAPAYSAGILVTGFGSGDLVAMRADSGAVAWTDSIAAASGQVGVATISAIVGQPVIVGELAFAIGTGGLMVALDLRAGRRLWEREVSGIQNLVAAGDFVFVTSGDQQVAAIEGRTGEVAWLTQLPQYLRPKTRGAALLWTGPVLAGGRLIYGGMRHDMVSVDAITGQLGPVTPLPDAVTVAPVVANGTLYLITDDGLLRAYR